MHIKCLYIYDLSLMGVLTYELQLNKRRFQNRRYVQKKFFFWSLRTLQHQTISNVKTKYRFDRIVHNDQYA